MKNRYWLIVLFVLVLPIALFFSFSKKTAKPEFAPDSVKTSGIQSSAATPTPPAPTPSPIPQHSVVIQDWSTANGARVYFVATEGIPIIDVQVNFDAGSARDNEKPGLAALCIHLLDQGISEASADLIAEKFEDSGAKFSVEIDRDRSIISLRSLTDPKLLSPVIALYTDLISNPTFPEKNIEILRSQTLIGLKRNLQQPATVASQAFFKAIYKNHPYAEPACGTIDGVSKITQADLVQFHQQYFVAKNATITIVGGISKEQATDIANQIAQKLPVGNLAAPLPNVELLTESTHINIPFPAEQTHVLTGQPCATENDPDYFSLLVGNNILGGGMLTSRLFNDVRNDRGLAYNVISAVLQLQKPAPFVIRLQTKNDQTKEAITVLQNTLLKFINEGPTEQEVLEAKQAIIRSFPVEISNNEKIINVVSRMGFYQLPLDSLAAYHKQVDAVTISEIKSAFQRRINPEKLGLIVVGATTSP
ncbi:MAG TPA: pitrilysin family protein [Gammaproteobacteria bacterium]|nr:pitrilysin family protein [Gammaproteobacteria bacterium]